MKKKLTITLQSFFLFSLVALAYGDNQNQKDSSNTATEQARQDYRQFAQQLKTLNQQYKQITGEMSKVLKEEGFPTYNEDTGEIGWSHDLGGGKPTSAANIEDTGDKMIVKLDLPGVKKDTFRIKIENNKWLHIQGERKDAAPPQGSFERLIELPALAQDKGTEAKYEDGVLTVTILKAPNMKKEEVVPIK